MMEERDLELTMPEAERLALMDLSDRLERERPVPRPAFRGQLRRHLLGDRGSLPSPMAGGFRLWAASYVVVGLFCLAVTAIGLAGAGPFAA